MFIRLSVLCAGLLLTAAAWAASPRLVVPDGTTMDEVVASVRRVNSIIGDIAVARREQNDGIDQINDAIAQMDAVTQQNAAQVEQAAAAAEAASLKHAVRIFKIHERHTAAGRQRALSRRQARWCRAAGNQKCEPCPNASVQPCKSRRPNGRNSEARPGRASRMTT